MLTALLTSVFSTAFSKEQISPDAPLQQFREATNWAGVKDATATEGKMELSTSGKGSILVNDTNKDKTIPYLLTKEEFGDCRIQMEFMIPKGSNSGIYVMGRYEVQIYDSFGRERVGTGDIGGIYQRYDSAKPKGKQLSEGSRPLTNAAKAPGEWQTLDIIFRAPHYNEEGQQRSGAYFEEVRLNGVLVQKDFSTSGPTRSAPLEGNAPKGPIAIQGDHGPIAIRSLKVTPTDESHLTRIPELDAYWTEVSRSVREGDYEAYCATCHPEAVIISGTRKVSYPLIAALARWEKDFSDTREGKVRGNVEFRFSERMGDFTTAHETGIFRYTTLAEGKAPKHDYMKLVALLVKSGGKWQILMEHQAGSATKVEWDALK